MWISSKEAVETLVKAIVLLVSNCSLGDLGHSFYYHKRHEHQGQSLSFLISRQLHWRQWDFTDYINQGKI